MDDNFYQAGRYNYHLGNHYVCTNDPDMAEVYYYMRFLENLDHGFTGTLARITTALDAWEEDNLYGELESLKKAREIIERGTDRAYRDWWNPNFKGKESEKYEEAYEIIMTAVPYLVKAEREAWALEKEREKNPDYPKERKLRELARKMESYTKGSRRWKNIGLMEEAFNLTRSLSDNVLDCYSNKAEKAVFLNTLLNCSRWYDNVSQNIEIRTYIDGILSELSDEEKKKYLKTMGENSRMLEKCRLYKDRSVSVDEFCERYEIADRFDPIERTDEWDSVIYGLYKKVSEKLGDSNNYGRNYDSMVLKERKRYLAKYGIEWKDRIEMNPEKKYRYFHFTIGGNLIATDYVELYKVYGAVEWLEMKSFMFSRYMKDLVRNLNAWVRKISSEKPLNADEEVLLKKVASAFRKAQKTYKENDRDEDTPLNMILEWVPPLHNLEYRRRFGTEAVIRKAKIETEEVDDLRDNTFELIAQVEEAHEKSVRDNLKTCSKKKRIVRENLNKLIEEYHHEDLFLVRAIYNACENWSTHKILNEKEFLAELKDAIDNHGSLEPERKSEWYHFSSVVQYNSEMTFMEDERRFKAIVRKTMDDENDFTTSMAALVYDILFSPTARFQRIVDQMEANGENLDLKWRNIRLLKECCEIVRQYPDELEDCYSTVLEKAMFLIFVLEYTEEGDCARLCIETRRLIDEIFTAADKADRIKYDSIWKNNNVLLRKREQYIDEELTMQEYCKINRIESYFDPVMRTEKWEEIAYDVYREVYDNLGDPEQYGENYYGLTLFEMKKVMKKYGIEWKDYVDMNPFDKCRYFHFNIDGNDIYTDYRELFEAYTCMGRLAAQNPETFGEDLKLAGQNVRLWLKNLTLNRKLNDSEMTRAEYLTECFGKAVGYYEKNGDEPDFAFDMAMDAVIEISLFEANLRAKNVVDPVEYEDTEAGRLRKETFDLLSQVETTHRDFDGNLFNITNDQEQKVLDNMKELIEKYGHNDLYLYRAALTACNNWATMMLVRPSSFSNDLADAIYHYGSLAPEREIDWTILQKVAEANPDMYFIEGMEKLYDIICTAIEQGDETVAYCATVVRDIIWEPENPIDED